MASLFISDHADEQAAAIASVQQQQGTITLDPTLQYQIRADNNAGIVSSLRLFQVMLSTKI